MTQFSCVRGLFEDRQHPFPHGALQEVVQVLHRGRAAPRVALLDGVARCGHMVGVVEQAEQPVEAIDGAFEPLVECPDEQRPLRRRLAQQVMPCAQVVVVARGLAQDPPLDHRGREGQRTVVPMELFDGRDRT